MLLWRSIWRLLLVFTCQGHVRRYCSEPWLKLLKRRTVGQAVPEIPLSVGSKLELLLRAFVFAKFPYTSPYTHAFVRVCIILPCIFVYISYVYTVYIHFSASYYYWRRDRVQKATASPILFSLFFFFIIMYNIIYLHLYWCVYNNNNNNNNNNRSQSSHQR